MAKFKRTRLGAWRAWRGQPLAFRLWAAWKRVYPIAGGTAQTASTIAACYGYNVAPENNEFFLDVPPWFREWVDDVAAWAPAPPAGTIKLPILSTEGIHSAIFGDQILR